MIKEFLLRLGVISKRIDGSTHWPRLSAVVERWLPWRWGFGICGLEIGDRGSHFAKPDYKRHTFWEGPQS